MSVNPRAFRLLSFVASLFLILSAAALVTSLFWEASTREYLRGFSDAVVPSNASTAEKIQSILDWMKSGPSRRPGVADAFYAARDPEDTLNYQLLLQVCGSATNAFINLAITKGLKVRRLLLLDSQGNTTHVDAEVFLGNRWVVVDPTFRRIMHASNGSFLTAQQLRNSVLLQQATLGLRGYLPQYSFARTTHLHLARLGAVGLMLGHVCDAFYPGWDKTELITLLVERISFAACVSSLGALLFFLLLCIAVSFYFRKRTGVRRVHCFERLRRGGEASFNQGD